VAMEVGSQWTSESALVLDAILPRCLIAMLELASRIHWATLLET
jgi:hypothetical protein